MIKESELSAFLKDIRIYDEFRLVPLAQEASQRKYYRIHFDREIFIGAQKTRKSNTLILCVVSPKPYKDEDHFINLSYFLADKGLSVPEIIAVDKKKAWLLLSDAGSNDLFSYVSKEKTFLESLKPLSQTKLSVNNVSKIERILFLALELMFKLHELEAPDYVRSRLFDEKKLYSEMQFLFDAISFSYKKHSKQYTRSSIIDSETQIFFEELCKYLGEQSDFVFTHRDYHSRNIMIQDASLDSEKPSLCLIDYQDARMGLAYYDFASFVYDPYLALSDYQLQQCLDYYKSHSKREWDEKLFYSVALQRLTKALGTYIYQVSQNGNIKYMKNIPQCIYFCRDIIAKEFSSDFKSSVAAKSFFENLELHFYPKFLALWG